MSATAQPVHGPYRVFEAGPGAAISQLRISATRDGHADLFWVDHGADSTARLLHARFRLADSTVAMPDTLRTMPGGSIELGEAAATPAPGWAMLLFEQAPRQPGGFYPNRTFLLAGAEQLTTAVLLDTGFTGSPMGSWSEHRLVDLTLRPGHNGGWHAGWVREGMQDWGGFWEPLVEPVLTVLSAHFVELWRDSCVGSTFCWGESIRARFAAAGPDSVMCMFRCSMGDWHEEVLGVHFPSEWCWTFQPQCPLMWGDLRRTHGGRLIALSYSANGAPPRIVELDGAGMCTELGWVGLTDDPAVMAWQENFGYAALGLHPARLLLARVDTHGVQVHPPGVLFEQTTPPEIADCAVAISDSGRVVAAWLERDSGAGATSVQLAATHWTTYLAQERDPAAAPPSTSRLSAFPNPFNARTTVTFTLPRAERVTLELFNLHGQSVRVLATAHLPAGEHALAVNGADLAAGIYFVRLHSVFHVKTVKVALLK